MTATAPALEQDAARPPADFLLGTAPEQIAPRIPFDPAVTALLAELSAELRRRPAARALPDVQAFAFWCRSANLRRLQADHQDGRARLGLGLLFHIAPGNVPVNFAFSLAFGLLAGNANLVRVPSRPLPQVEIIASALADLLAKPCHAELAPLITLVRYPAGSPWTGQFSARCDGRILWGGDETVSRIRQLPIPPRSREITFADRYSLCVINPQAVSAADEAALDRLVEGFFNDTYLMDQNACSSPHLIIWQGEAATAEAGRLRFWGRLQQMVARRYALAPVHAVDKYTQVLTIAATDHGQVREIGRWRNDIHTIGLHHLAEPLDQLRGRFGLFHEYHSDNLEALAPLVGRRFQTLTYFGVDKTSLRDFVLEHRLPGIDRIVPVGRALDMDALWDGYDLIASLSRIIDVA